MGLGRRIVASVRTNPKFECARIRPRRIPDVFIVKLRPYRETYALQDVHKILPYCHSASVVLEESYRRFVWRLSHAFHVDGFDDIAVRSKHFRRLLCLCRVSRLHNIDENLYGMSGDGWSWPLCCLRRICIYSSVDVFC